MTCQLVTAIATLAGIALGGALALVATYWGRR